ncbi:expansin-like A1 [Typha latifolia]|uniref:expansin-like A1 n=1 Tax=Typha latifolia TaxID=4733 RepID=UPI003C2F5F85
MDIHFFFFLIISILALLLSHTTACDPTRCLSHSKAAYFSSSSSSSSSSNLDGGACGYGSMASQFYGGYNIAAGSNALFREGDGCGRCYELRCTDARLCSKGGVKVILTDMNGSNHSDFVLTKEAFKAMAQKGMGHHLTRLKMVDVEYRRILCDHKKNNLSIRVENRSQKPNHLTIKFLYQGGLTDIAAVELAQVGSPIWHGMEQIKGPIWSSSRAPPQGPLQLRIVVTSGYSGKWVWAEKEVLPKEWKVGEVYNTGVQINDIAMEACLSCGRGDEWR